MQHNREAGYKLLQTVLCLKIPSYKTAMEMRVSKTDGSTIECSETRLVLLLPMLSAVALNKAKSTKLLLNQTLVQPPLLQSSVIDSQVAVLSAAREAFSKIKKKI